MIEQELKIRPIKSLCIYGDIYHIWLSMETQNVLDIKVSDNVSNMTYIAGEFDGFKYTIKNQRIFNDVFIRAIKEKPTLLKILFKFYGAQTITPNPIRNIKIKFKCFKRRINIQIHKKGRKTKK